MNDFEWKKEYETGIELIDKQHKSLFKWLDKLQLAIYKGESKSKLSELLAFLENYIDEHFTYEENLMKMNDYIYIYEHIATHNEFIELFRSFKKDFQKRGGDAYLGMIIEKEIRAWWQNHILRIDMEYVPYLKNT